MGRYGPSAILLVLLMVSRASALEYQIQQLGNGTSFLVVSGPFLPNESLAPFTKALATSGARIITFDSPGGSIETAIHLGHVIRAMGLSTIQLRKLECASACSLAFVGGVLRSADPGSIGVHRTSFAPDTTINRDAAVAGVQAVTAEIIAYLDEMGVDPKLLAFSLRYDESDIRYLSASEMAELHVTTSPATSPSETVPNAPTASRETSPRDLQDAAIGFVRRLIETDEMDPNTTLDLVISSYADTIDYYGSTKSLQEVVADKRRYFQRWPERAYKIRPDTVLATCANSRCMVSGVYDWTVRSLTRNRQAQGVAQFTYTIAISDKPKVVAEGGRIVSKR
jgi:hypothetical protein